MIFYVGDTHGRINDIQKIEAEANEAGAKIIIQVGDFGMHFADNCKVAEWFNTRSEGLPWITCGGNHDNWPLWRSLPQIPMFDGMVTQLAEGCFFAERGASITILGEKHLFFGGAESIDKAYRVEGRDWWKDESPTRQETNDFFDIMESFKPDVVITHDAPLRVNINKLNRRNNPTPKNLENVLEWCDHTPARWYFGHHHILQEWRILGTHFICCGYHGEYVVSPQAHMHKE